MKPRINRAKIDATTEADIRRHMRADGQDGNDLAGLRTCHPSGSFTQTASYDTDRVRASAEDPIEHCVIGNKVGSCRGRSFTVDDRGKKSKSCA